MPIYEYLCPRCKTNFEAIRSIDKRYEAKCPECKSNSVLIPSNCHSKMFTRIDQADGEGFSSRFVSNSELTEMRKGNAMGQTY